MYNAANTCTFIATKLVKYDNQNSEVFNFIKACQMYAKKCFVD